MIEEVTVCPEQEKQAQVAFLASTPVKGVAHSIKDGRYYLKKGTIKNLESLGELETIYENMGNRFACVETGRDRFLVKEVLNILQNQNEHKNDQLAISIHTEIESALDKMSPSYQVEHRITILHENGNHIIKAGNKRAVAFYEYKRSQGEMNISLPVFLVEESK